MTIVWVNAQEKAAGMGALAQAVGERHIYEWAEDVSLRGEDAIRDRIMDGGDTKKGGPRYLTGQMYAAAQSRTDMAGAGTAYAESGYFSEPYWTKYQELGTSRGVKALNAMEFAERAMEKGMDDAGVRMLQRIEGEWNAI